MKKIAFTVIIIVIALSCLTACNDYKAVIPGEQIELVKNAQYLPSKELLVEKNDISTKSLSSRSDEFSPFSLLSGGISESDYDKLIEIISPIDTPYNRSFTVQDARDEAIRILSEGVIYDKWFAFRDGDLSGEGSFFITDKDGRLTITRCTSFQPWVYESDKNRFVGNEHFNFEKPNYPIRSDVYLRLSFYQENGKEVVECEVVDNLSYYDNVSHVCYQFMRNVKDTSFTKIQTVFRSTLQDPSESGAWGYDLDTKEDYSYQRNFIQIDYSSPDDIKWLSATQYLPYAFDASASSTIELGTRENGEGFYYSHYTKVNENDVFSLTPDDKYLSVDLNAFDSVSCNALFRKGDQLGYYSKSMLYGNYYIEVGNENDADHINVKMNSLASVLNSLSVNACGSGLPDADSSMLVFDASDRNSSFEIAANTCLDDIANSAIASSEMAKEYKNNDIYNMRIFYIEHVKENENKETAES